MTAPARPTLCEVDDCPTPDLCRGIGCQAIYARKSAEAEAAAGDPDITVGVERPLEAQWVIDNIYTIARRESGRSADKLRPEMWGHVLRLCEKAGAATRTVGVLRSESRPTPPATLVERLREMCAEIWHNHRDKGHDAYNECEVGECEWCRITRESLDALAALQSPPPADGSQP